jgi:hypothetical protein
VLPEGIGDTLTATVLEDSFRLRRQPAAPHDLQIGAQTFDRTVGNHFQLYIDGR